MMAMIIVVFVTRYVNILRDMNVVAVEVSVKFFTTCIRIGTKTVLALLKGLATSVPVVSSLE